jgi:hypothetical protein
MADPLKAQLLEVPAPPPQHVEVLRVSTTPFRFYCLLIATLVAGLQGAFWNNFGPISAAVNPYFGWNDATIAVMSNWGCARSPSCLGLM